MPQFIGPYRILREVGSGGMGTVYEGLQENPPRPVAIKVLRADLASPDTLRRFEYESTVLARLHHPAVAQVLHAGTFPHGELVLPYFVMEFIQGARTLTGYANAESLSRQSRLKLFATVCDAVHHGHQKGVIHRDLKPENLLVDAAGNPKVIDFGVARTTDPMASTRFTEAGQLIGTLQYMSPEQFAGKPDDVDVRSDVYSLGLVLYELISGRRPYDLTGLGFADAVKVLLERDPTRIGSIDSTLRGDFERILAKALAKEPSLRYQSAAQLARDVEAYLRGDSVSARLPTMSYRLQVFVRRHRAAAIAAGSIFLITAVAAVTSSLLYLRAETDRREAVAARTAESEQRQAALASKMLAEQQARIAAEVNRFLNEDLLAAANPARSFGREVTMRQVLDAASAKIEGRFVEDPAVEQALQRTLGETYLTLGDFSTAQTHVQRALELATRHLGAEDPETLDLTTTLGLVEYSLGRYDQAVDLMSANLTRLRRTLGENDPRVYRAVDALGCAYWRQQRFDEAEPYLEEALAGHRRLLGDEDLRTLESMNHLAFQHVDRGHAGEDKLQNYGRARSLMQDALRTSRQALGEDNPATLEFQGNIAWLSHLEGRTTEALELSEDCLERRRRVLGNEHPATLISVNNLALVYRALGRLEEAETLLLEDLETSRRVVGDRHPEVLTTILNLGRFHRDLDHLEKAEAYFAEASTAFAEGPMSDSIQSALAHHLLGETRVDLGRHEEAEDPLLAAHEILAENAFDRNQLLHLIKSLVEVYEHLEEPEEASRWRAELERARAEMAADGGG